MGIPYSFGSNSEKIPVTSVTGETIYTTHSLNMMRQEMEHYIEKFSVSTVINTTKDGADIKGTKYITLTEQITNFGVNRVVVEDWLLKPRRREIDGSHLLTQRALMLKQHRELNHLFSELHKTLHALQFGHLPELFQRFDNLFKSLQHNLFFRYFLQPMNRVSYEILFSKMINVKIETDMKKKAEFVISLFGNFLRGCYNDYNEVQIYYEDLNRIIEKYAEMKKGAGVFL